MNESSQWQGYAKGVLQDSEQGCSEGASQELSQNLSPESSIFEP
jgi:hypothetical protein